MLPHGYNVGDIIYYKGEENGLTRGNYFGLVVEDPRQSEKDVYALWVRDPMEAPPPSSEFREDYGGLWGGRGYMIKGRRLHLWSKVVIDYRADQVADEDDELL